MVVSPTNGTTANTLINRARRSALRLVHRPQKDRDLVAEIYEHRAEVDGRRLRGAASSEPAGDETPEEFRATLRRAKGEQNHILVTIDGIVIPLVLNGSGEEDLEHEDFVWGWIVQRVRRSIQPGAPA